MCVKKKTEIIVFRNGGPLRNYEKWFYGGNPVSTTSIYKYMGILFTSVLSWSSAKSKLAKQARKLKKSNLFYKGLPKIIWDIHTYRYV